jgi:lysophospholipase L1-like esterase
VAKLRNVIASARRSRVAWAAGAVAAAVLVAGGVVLATQTSPPPSPSPQTSTRAVAFGDSVPYGHGLANPYRTPQDGLPSTAVSEAPSAGAYPSLVAQRLGLTMHLRPDNCDLTGDQLAISGAVADAADDTSRDTQCPVPPQPARNLGDELAASQLALHPARLVLVQIGADDINFGACLVAELARVAGTSIGLGTSCVSGGTVTPAVAADLARVRASLARAIEAMSPDAGRIAVLDYYQPIPSPAQIADDAALSGFGTNLVCDGLKANAAGTSADAQVVLRALNDAIAGAVHDARAHHVTNVRFLDISSAFAGHGLCTADPWVFSAQTVSDATLAADAQLVLAAKACNDVASLPGCATVVARAASAEQQLRGYVWRAAHPTAKGQQVIADAVARQLRTPATAATA